MILFHPAKDINHCMYRMIALLLSTEQNLTVEKLRVLDFYYSFPHLLKKISPWPQDIREYKQYIKKILDPYEEIINIKRLFFEMERVQKTSIATLYAKSLLDNKLYRDDKIALDSKLVPVEIIECIKNDSFINSDVFKLISRGLMETTWEGKQGLKFRTGLLEYKYDE